MIWKLAAKIVRKLLSIVKHSVIIVHGMFVYAKTMGKGYAKWHPKQLRKF